MKLRVSKEGYDAEITTDQRNLIFDSDLDALKFSVSGTTNITVTNTEPTKIVTVAHNLGYTPFFLVYVKCDVGKNPNKNHLVPSWNDYDYDYGVTGGWTIGQAYADSTNLYLEARKKSEVSTPWEHNYTFYYKIFTNSLSDIVVPSASTSPSSSISPSASTSPSPSRSLSPSASISPSISPSSSMSSSVSSSVSPSPSASTSPSSSISPSASTSPSSSVSLSPSPSIAIPSLYDSYSESNADFGRGLCSSAGLSNQVGQSVKGSGGKLYSAVFQMYTDGTITGNAYAKVYSHSGTFGINGTPNTLLATSDAFDVSVLNGTPALYTFNFTGANAINLTNGGEYFVVVYFNGGDSSNRCIVRGDQTSPTHWGNFVDGHDNWTADATKDLCFYIYTNLG